MNKEEWTVKVNKEKNYLLSRQVFLRANLINSVIYKAFSNFFQYLFINFNFYIIHICTIKFVSLMQNFVCLYPEGFSLNVALWKQREYMNTHSYLLRELWLVLKLPTIHYFYTNMSFKIRNSAVKFSRRLLCTCCFTGNFPVLYCCLRLKKDYFEHVFFIWFSDFSNFLLRYKKFFRVVAKKFHFSEYKKVHLFHLLSSESYFLKYKRNTRQESFISGNIRKCVR